MSQALNRHQCLVLYTSMCPAPVGATHSTQGGVKHTAVTCVLVSQADHTDQHKLSLDEA